MPEEVKNNREPAHNHPLEHGAPAHQSSRRARPFAWQILSPFLRRAVALRLPSSPLVAVVAGRGRLAAYRTDFFQPSDLTCHSALLS
jgi:hypothetical protein